MQTTARFTAPRFGRKVTIEKLEAAAQQGVETKLYCRRCHGEYSTNVSDYFWARPNHAFKCCKVNNLLLVRQ